jgi:hypothetical protein
MSKTPRNYQHRHNIPILRLLRPFSLLLVNVVEELLMCDIESHQQQRQQQQ